MAQVESPWSKTATFICKRYDMDVVDIPFFVRPLPCKNESRSAMSASSNRPLFAAKGVNKVEPDIASGGESYLHCNGGWWQIGVLDGIRNRKCNWSLDGVKASGDRRSLEGSLKKGKESWGVHMKEKFENSRMPWPTQSSSHLILSQTWRHRFLDPTSRYRKCMAVSADGRCWTTWTEYNADSVFPTISVILSPRWMKNF